MCFTPPVDTIDLYTLAGQSNVHGHSSVSTLTSSQSSQNGYFYSSWHNNTSDEGAEFIGTKEECEQETLRAIS
jgi:hypothetical protein